MSIYAATVWRWLGALVVSLFLLMAVVAQAQFNPEINYQGKLTTPTGAAVADGTYQMVFRLYTVPTGGAAIWTETWSGAAEVPVENGLFSVMLGSTTALTSVDFSQTLYLGVTIEADAEMSPRKILGAVPAAFVADEAGNAATVGGVASSSFVRSDVADTISGSSASTMLTVVQNGAGDIFNLFDDVTEVFSVVNGGNIGIGTTSPTYKLSVGGDAIITGRLFDSVASAGANGYVLQTTGSGTRWVATSTLGLGNIYGTTIDPAELTATDFGSFSCNGTTCTLDGSAVDISTHTNLSISAAGLALSGDAVVLSAGYGIPLTASTTEWSTFYLAPSSRISAGSNLAWTGNSLAVVSSPAFSGSLSVTGTSTFTGNSDFGAGIDVVGNITVTGTVDGKDIATNAAMLNEAETITGNWVNTANPWADNEVVDALTISGGTINSTNIGATTPGTAVFTSATTTSATTTNLAVSSLTAGRVPYVTTAGRLIDGANLTFDGTTLVLGTDVGLSRGAANRLDLATGDSLNLVSGGYQVGGTSVLTSTTLGAGVVSSSLTSVGTLTTLGVSGTTTLATTTLASTTIARINMAGDSVTDFTGTGLVVTGGVLTVATSSLANLNADLLDSLDSTYFLNATNLNAGTLASARLSGSYTGITGLGTITTGTWQGTAIASTYLDPAVILSTEIDTYSELNAIVADVTLTHNGLIDTSAELATILGDETGTAGGFVRATSPTITAPLIIGGLVATSSTLASTTNSQSIMADFRAGDNNYDGLQIGLFRHTTGSDWQSASVRLQRLVDFTAMGYMQFGNHNGSDLVTFGKGTSTEYMRLTSSGLLGIGTTSPMSLLSVAGNSAFTGQMNLVGTAANIALGSNWLSGDGGDEGVYVDANGSVGIGTSTPVHKFDVYGGGGVGVSDDGTVKLELFGSALGYGIVGTDTNSPLHMRTNNQSRLVLDTAGNVGIGTTSPSQMLTVGNNNQFTVTSAGAVDATSLTLDTALAVAEGGTGAVTFTTGSLLVGNGTSAVTSTTTAGLKSTLALNNVENTALSTWAGTTNLTTVGTVTAGTWNATALTDAYVADTLTISGGTIGSNNISGTLTTTAALTIGDGGDTIAVNSSNWDVSTAGVFTGGTWQGTAIASTYLDTSVILSTEIDTSAELATVLTDETGTGAAVFAAAPTLTGTVVATGAIQVDVLRASGALLDLRLMPSIDTAGTLRFGRSDGTARFHEITAFNATTNTANYLDFAVHTGTVGATTSVMRLFGNGAVAIGTTTPPTTSRFMVAGDVRIGNAGSLWLEPEAGFATHQIVASADHNRTIRFMSGTTNSNGGWEFYNSDLSTSLLNIKQSGDVGVGTTTPAYRLVVQDGANVVANLTSLSTYSLLNFQDAGGSANIGTNGQSLIFDVNMDGRELTILANGNVGIGTSTPSQMLTVGNNNQFTVTSAGAVDATSLTLDTALAVAEGGTGAVTFTAGSLLVGNGASAVTSTTTAGLKSTLALNNVENTALSTWAGTTNLTTLGTITSGVWQGTPIGIAYGGLGAAFTDPNADRLMFFDDSAGAVTGITTLSGLSISGTTLTVNDVTCTDCLGTTEIADSYLLNTTDSFTGNLTLTDSNGDAIVFGENGGGAGRFDLAFQGASTTVQNMMFFGGDVSNGFRMDSFTVQSDLVTLTSNTVALSGDLTVTGGDMVLGTTNILSGGDTASLNNIDAINATTETTLEAAIDALANLTTVGTITAGTWNATALTDAYVADILTISGGTIGSNNISGTLTTTAALTIGDGGDNVIINSNTWDISGAGVGSGFTGFTTTGTLDAAAGDFSSTLTMSGTAANIALGSNYLSGDGGDEGIYIDSTGSVGIGTTTPQTKLHTNGSVYVTTAAGDPGLWVQKGDASVTDSVWGAIATSIGTSSHRFSIGNNVTPTFVGFNELFSVLSTGNVGIGTSSPMSLLSVAGNSAFTGQMNLVGTAANIALGSNYLSGDGGDEGVYVSASGNVGIGTTTTNASLTVDGDVTIANNSFPSLMVNNGGNVMMGTTTNDFYEFTLQKQTVGGETAAGFFRIFDAAGGSILDINGAGNVGIGTSSPSQLLSVAGNTYITGTVTGATWQGTPIGIAYGGLGAAFTDPNADRLMFFDDSAGAVTGITTLSGLAISGTTLTVNDVTCTDCLGTTEIADSYVLNTGDAMTGDLNINDGSKLALNMISAVNSQQIGVAAGEFFTHLDTNISTTTEAIWLAAEGGVRIVSSPDNLATGWAGRNEATLVDSTGASSLPGDLTVNGNITVTGTVDGKDIATNAAMLNEAETIAGNWVNTTNPWADNEVADILTISGGTIGSNNISGTLTTTAALTIGDGGDTIAVNSSNWDVSTAGVFTGGTWQGTAIASTYLDTAVILSTEIDTYSELNAIVADQTLATLGQTQIFTGTKDFTGGSVGMEYGINGKYSEAGGANGYGASIWSLDTGWQGTAAGASYTPGTFYGINWLRSGHGSSSTAVGEGLYVFTNGALRGGLGSAGFSVGTAEQFTVTNGGVVDALGAGTFGGRVTAAYSLDNSASYTDSDAYLWANNNNSTDGVKAFVRTEAAGDGYFFGTRYNTNEDVDFVIGRETTANVFSERFTLLNNGHVGIGESAPGSKLEVWTGSTVTGRTSNTVASVVVGNRTTTNNNHSDLRFDTTDLAGVNAVGAKIAGIFTSHATSAVTAELGFFTSDTGTLTERMTIDTTGNVGIGTTTPGANLAVQDATSALMVLADGTGSTNPVSATVRASAIDNKVELISYENLVTASQDLGVNAQDLAVLTFDNVTNAAIGTNNTAPLIMAINNTEVARFTTTGLTTLGTLDAVAGDFSSTLTMSGTAANIALGSNYLSGDGGDEGVYVSASGNVGIGTTTTNASLTVDGDVTIANNSFPSLMVNNGGNVMMGTTTNDFYEFTLQKQTVGGETAAGFFRIFDAAGGSILDINGAGNVGIGTTTPGSKLTVSGTGRFTGAAVFENTITAGINATAQVTAGAGDIIAGDTTGGFQFDASANDFYAQQSTADTGPVQFLIRKSRGTAAAPSVVTSGDDMFMLRGYAYATSSAFSESARMTFDTAGTVGATVPGIIQFATRNAAGAFANRVTIDAEGWLGIGTTSPMSALAVVGSATITGNTAITGDLTVTGGDMVLGTTNILSGGDTASLNNIDAINATTETTLEAAIDALVNLTTVGTITSGVWNGTALVDAYVADTITAGDVICTDCLTTTEIADSYVLNTGDTMTGDLLIDKASAVIDLGDNANGSNMRLYGSHPSGAFLQAGTSSADVAAVLNITRYNTTNTNISDFNILTDRLDLNGHLYLGGTAANISLGSNWLTGDGTDSEGIAIDSTGEVGIGIMPSTYNYKMQVLGGNFGSSQALNGYALRFTASDAGGGWLGGVFGSSDSGGTATFGLYGPSNTTAGANTTQPIVAQLGASTSAQTMIYSGASESIRVDASGNVGIGDTTPTEAQLVIGSAGAGNLYFSPNTASTGANKALCWDNAGATLLYDCGASPIADYAESYAVTSGVSFGHILMVTEEQVTQIDGEKSPRLTKATAGGVVLGIASNNFGDFTSTAQGAFAASERIIPVALKGRVPVKISLEAGAIAVGDRIALSATPGVGKKATEPGEATVGYALAPYTASSTGDSVLVFVDNDEHVTTLEVVRAQLFSLDTAATSTDLFAAYRAVDGGDTIWSRLVTLAEGMVDGILNIAGISAGVVETDELCIGSTCVTESELIDLLNNANTAPAPAGDTTSDSNTSSDESSAATDEGSVVTPVPDATSPDTTDPTPTETPTPTEDPVTPAAPDETASSGGDYPPSPSEGAVE